MRRPFTHCGFPPLQGTYDYMLWSAIELALQTNKRYVSLDWKQHWRVADEEPNGEHWEVVDGDVVFVEENET